MRYGSVCSGIEAATVAWHPLGWKAAFYSEIEKFPCAVLAHHYPRTPNHGDMTRFMEWPDADLDVLVGGTPCQSFSVAGLRKGMADPRGNLALVYLALADRYRPRWLVWENVPGVLSSAGGRDFGAFLGGLGQLGYGWAYRVLDAQYFGLAQRRKRVFVVASLGGWQRAAAVLFERHGLQGHPAPRREAREGIANAITERPDRGGGNSEGQRLIPTLARCVTTGEAKRQDYETCTIIPAPIAFGWQNSSQQGDSASEHVTPTLDKSKTPAVAVDCYNGAIDGEATHTLRAGNGNENGGVPAAMQGMAVRRLTPRECERLQGFPDDYTLLPGKSADGPRYKALGNSFAVPVVRWIGERIAQVDAIQQQEAAA